MFCRQIEDTFPAVLDIVDTSMRARNNFSVGSLSSVAKRDSLGFGAGILKKTVERAMEGTVDLWYFQVSRARVE